MVTGQNKLRTYIFRLGWRKCAGEWTTHRYAVDTGYQPSDQGRVGIVYCLVIKHLVYHGSVARIY